MVTEIMDRYEKNDGIILPHRQGHILFNLSKGETWYIYKIELGGVPSDADVSVSYKDRANQNVSLPVLTASQFPLNFKKTATDQPFIIYPEGEVKITVSNNLGVPIHAYVTMYFNRAREVSVEV